MRRKILTMALATVLLVGGGVAVAQDAPLPSRGDFTVQGEGTCLWSVSQEDHTVTMTYRGYTGTIQTAASLDSETAPGHAYTYELLDPMGRYIGGGSQNGPTSVATYVCAFMINHATDNYNQGQEFLELQRVLAEG